MDKLLLIDGNSLINRAFYANPPMTTKSGVPTGAVFGFTNMLIKMIHDISPKYICVAFDVKSPTFRHELFTEYKGTRKPMPDDLRPQIPLLKDLLKTMGIYTYEQAGIEADDIIGTIAKSTTIDTVIVTGDKDSFQLVDNETSVYFTKRGISDLDIYTEQNFKEKTGITPSQIIDLKALMGDSSDNIPGVKGVGKKTALSLVQTYGTVENLYEHLSDQKGKLLENLTSCKEICFLSKTLATIRTNANMPVEVDKMVYSFPFNSQVKKQFADLEFKTFTKKEELFNGEDEIIDQVQVEGDIIVQTITVTDLKQIQSLSDKKLAFTLDKNLNLSNGVCEYEVLIKDNFFDQGFLLSDVLPVLKTLFESDKEIIVFDKKAVMHYFNKYGFTFKAKLTDVSILKYLADFTGRDETLLDVLEEYSLDKKTPATSLFTLYNKLYSSSKEQGLLPLYNDVELPLVDVLYEMELNGFKVDQAVLQELSDKFLAILAETEQKIFNLAGEVFNVKSPKQLGEILFDKLGLKSGKKNKKGYSTNAEILESLENDHEIIPLVLKHRQLSKLVSTYIEGFKPLIDKNTGLIHTSFNQKVTTTGRLSSKEPNLQNIPIREEIGKEIRKFFIPRDSEHILIGADYSQIELRLLAHFSGCEKLIKAFNNDEDIHTLTASEVFGVKPSEVTKEMRRSAKAVNFGIIYGISEFGLAKNIKTTSYKAREYIKTYFEKYPEVKAYMDKNVAFAKENGYVSTLLERKRYIREINSSNFNVRSFGERAAMNMPLQGSSADIIKIAMVNVFKRLKRENLASKLILQVHDELIIDALKTEQEQVIKLLIEEMENAVKLSVPLTVEAEVGETWFDAK